LAELIAVSTSAREQLAASMVEAFALEKEVKNPALKGGALKQF
jgi:hypothetical protein